MTCLPGRLCQFGHVLNDCQNDLLAVEDDLASVSENLDGFAVGFEMLPAFGTLKIASVAHGCKHPLPLGLRTDIKHCHAGDFVCRIAVKRMGRFIHDNEC